jgi:hypothetical protein
VIFIILIMVPIVLVCLFGLKSLYYAGAILAVLYAAAIFKAKSTPEKTAPSNQDYFSNPTPK